MDNKRDGMVGVEDCSTGPVHIWWTDGIGEGTAIWKSAFSVCLAFCKGTVSHSAPSHCQHTHTHAFPPFSSLLSPRPTHKMVVLVPVRNIT